jgi:two-component system, sensor histidine kinase
MRLKPKVIFILILLMTIPLLLVGLSSALYYREVIKSNIWDDNLQSAKTISVLTPTYINSARLYLESLSDRPLVISSTRDKNITFLNETVIYAGSEFVSLNKTPIFDEVFITDTSGMVLSSYPYRSLEGKNVRDMPYVQESINTKRFVISDAILSDDTKKPTIYVVVPIDNLTQNEYGENASNADQYGIMVGEISLDDYAKTLFSTQVKNNQYIYLVNRTGHIMVHNDPVYMATMKNYSSVPAVGKVLMGSEGVMEQYNPVENDQMLSAYSPITPYRWGVVVALPVNVAYQPIWDTLLYFLVSLILLSIIAILLAIYLSNYFTKPVLDIAKAAAKMPDGDYRKYLPIGRKDEFGELARSFDDMANTIQHDKDEIIAQRDRAELYVDIMGHDINNINQVAMSNLEFLKENVELPADLKPLVGHALTAIEGSAGIIDNVRKIQKVSSEEFLTERIDLDRVISETIHESHWPPDKKVELSYAGHEGMYVDAVRLLKEAFSNIINNAIKYSGSDVHVDILPREIMVDGKKYYEISISDNGPGIPDNVKPKLFQKFQRGTKRANGTGLGLYITRMLIERFGGSVRVEDRVPGDHTQGSKFVIKLPAA